MSDAVELVPHDTGWAAEYERIRPEIAACFLETPPLVLEHVGSSAVSGLPAKPVIDIIVEVEDLEAAGAALERLASLGFQYRPDVSDRHRAFLQKLDAAGERTHHLHVHDTPDEVRRHVLFRDLLRNDRQVFEGYLALKRDLAHRFRYNRGAYSRGKDDFIDKVIAEAGGPARLAWR